MIYCHYINACLVLAKYVCLGQFLTPIASSPIMISLLSGAVQWGEFKARGTLTYTGPKLVTTKSKRLVSVQIEQIKFDSADLANLQTLIDEDRPYRVRVQVCSACFLLHF